MSAQHAISLMRLLIAKGMAPSRPVAIDELQDFVVEAGLDDVVYHALITAGRLHWIEVGPQQSTLHITEMGALAGRRATGQMS